MKLILAQSKTLQIASLEDLVALIPIDFDGEALNYGQGEGQFRVNDVIWGIYLNSQSDYYLQFEEGVCEWSILQKMIIGILQRIANQLGDEPILHVVGILE